MVGGGGRKYDGYAVGLDGGVEAVTASLKVIIANGDSKVHNSELQFGRWWL